ncbi:MAG: hypothetical protein KBT59_09990 [Sphingomonadales bacterium]|nr:hypothetical protein [Sphingomonadales bacterium]
MSAGNDRPAPHQFVHRRIPRAENELYKLYTVMNLKNIGVFQDKFRSISGPQKRDVQLGNRQAEQPTKGKAPDSDGLSLSASADGVDQDSIFKEPFRIWHKQAGVGKTVGAPNILPVAQRRGGSSRNG